MEDLNLEASDASNVYHGGADGQTHMMNEQIVSPIAEHRIAPDTRFREEQPEQWFAVSRKQAGQVLQRLEHEQLAERHPRRGVAVACPDQGETRDIFGACNRIEPWIVGQMCERSAPEDWVGIWRVVQQEHQSHPKGDRHAAVRLSGEFHQELAAAADNRPLNKTKQELAQRTCLANWANQAPTQDTCRDDELDAVLKDLPVSVRANAKGEST